MRRLGVLAVGTVALVLGVGIGSLGFLSALLMPAPPAATITALSVPAMIATPLAASNPLPTNRQTGSPTRTAGQLLQSIAPSVVRIRAADSEGTGFVAFQAGQVLTAYHIVGSPTARPTVVTTDGLQYESVVLGADEQRDLALLTVPSLKAAVLPLASGVSVGDTVIAVGFAAGLHGPASVTRGIVSAKRMEPDTGMALVQTDAPINPGNSGGPLLNEAGSVVGVNIARLRGARAQYENMGFAVSATEVASIADHLRSGVVRLLPTPTAKPEVDARNVVLKPSDLKRWSVNEWAYNSEPILDARKSRTMLHLDPALGDGYAFFDVEILSSNHEARARVDNSVADWRRWIASNPAYSAHVVRPVSAAEGYSFQRSGPSPLKLRSISQEVSRVLAIDAVFLRTTVMGPSSLANTERVNDLMLRMISKIR